MIKFVRTAAVVILMAGVSSTALAGNNGIFDSLMRGTAETVKGDKLTSEERAIIRTVFDGLFGEDEDQISKENAKSRGKGKYGSKSMPPGLAKRSSLPPGLQKQIDETGTLPPGLAKRDLPSDLRNRIKTRKGQELVWIDDDVYLIETATQVILDVVKDLF